MSAFSIRPYWRTSARTGTVVIKMKNVRINSISFLLKWQEQRFSKVFTLCCARMCPISGLASRSLRTWFFSIEGSRRTHILCFNRRRARLPNVMLQKMNEHVRFDNFGSTFSLFPLLSLLSLFFLSSFVRLARLHEKHIRFDEKPSPFLNVYCC